MDKKEKMLSNEEFDLLFTHQINYPIIEVEDGNAYGIILSLTIDGKNRAIILSCEAKEKLIQDLNNVVQKQEKEREQDKLLDDFSIY